MSNKEEELEAIVPLENRLETGWDDSHNQSAAMDGCKLFRRDREGRRGSGVTLMSIGLSVYGSESWGRPARQISWWEFVTDHPARMKRWINCSRSVWEKPHDPWPLFPWRNSI